MSRIIVIALGTFLHTSPALAAPIIPPTSGAPIGRGGASRMVEVDEYHPPDVGGPARTGGSGTRWGSTARNAFPVLRHIPGPGVLPGCYYVIALNRSNPGKVRAE
jgi:hypothetical protein